MDLLATQVLDLDVAADVITAVTGALVTAEIELFTNNFQPTRSSVIGDFDLPTYTGYAAEAVTWLAPSVSDDGQVEIIGTAGEFRPTDAVTPNTVYGMLVTDGVTKVHYAARFPDGPLPMEDALDAILLTLRARIPAAGICAVVS